MISNLFMVCNEVVAQKIIELVIEPQRVKGQKTPEDTLIDGIPYFWSNSMLNYNVFLVNATKNQNPQIFSILLEHIKASPEAEFALGTSIVDAFNNGVRSEFIKEMCDAFKACVDNQCDKENSKSQEEVNGTKFNKMIIKLCDAAAIAERLDLVKHMIGLSGHEIDWFQKRAASRANLRDLSRTYKEYTNILWRLPDGAIHNDKDFHDKLKLLLASYQEHCWKAESLEIVCDNEKREIEELQYKLKQIRENQRFRANVFLGAKIFGALACTCLAIAGGVVLYNMFGKGMDVGSAVKELKPQISNLAKCVSQFLPKGARDVASDVVHPK